MLSPIAATLRRPRAQQGGPGAAALTGTAPRSRRAEPGEPRAQTGEKGILAPFGAEAAQTPLHSQSKKTNTKTLPCLENLSSASPEPSGLTGAAAVGSPRLQAHGAAPGVPSHAAGTGRDEFRGL